MFMMGNYGWLKPILKYFYYQACCNRSNSWINLGSAIRLAQALGMHRKSLMIKLKIKKYQFIDVDYGDHYMFVIVLVV